MKPDWDADEREFEARARAFPDNDAVCPAVPVPDRAPLKVWRGRGGRAGNMGFILPSPEPSKCALANCWPRVESY
jgi:hypothetical protein